MAFPHVESVTRNKRGSSSCSTGAAEARHEELPGATGPAEAGSEELRQFGCERWGGGWLTSGASSGAWMEGPGPAGYGAGALLSFFFFFGLSHFL